MRELSPRKRPPAAAEEERCASRPPPEGAGAAAGAEPRPLERAAAGGWCRSCQAQLAELRRQAARLAAGGCPPNAPPVSEPSAARTAPSTAGRSREVGGGMVGGVVWGGTRGRGSLAPSPGGVRCTSPQDLEGEPDGKAGDFQPGRVLQKFKDYPSRALSKSETARRDAHPLVTVAGCQKQLKKKRVTLSGGAGERAGGCAGTARDAARSSPGGGAAPRPARRGLERCPPGRVTPFPGMPAGLCCAFILPTRSCR